MSNALIGAFIQFYYIEMRIINSFVIDWAKITRDRTRLSNNKIRQNDCQYATIR